MHNYNIMKLLSTLFFLTILSVSCQNSDKKAAVPAAIQTTALKTIEISVNGMTCEGCEGTVKESLTKVAGVTECVASFKENKATVKFDSTKTNYTALAAAITEAGYEVLGEKDVK